ncbi:hypothetical protein [Streptomyces sp. S1]|nr:hypothetical protein [Streptomyces sp. S1]
MARISITTTQGETIETTSDDASVVREFENLPFEADHIAVVTVTEDEH